MLSVVALATTFLAGTGAASAVPVVRDSSAQTKLAVSSTDGTGRFTGAPVAACHSGAAIEALCVVSGSDAGTTFSVRGITTGTENPFFLVYTLDSSPHSIDQQLGLNKHSNDSNIGYGFFGTDDSPVELQQDAANNKVGVLRESGEAQFDWYVCSQTTLGNTFDTVSFVEDFAEPTDPSCAPVSLFRVV